MQFGGAEKVKQLLFSDCFGKTALERQDLSRINLVHHELESVIIIIVKPLLYSCHYHGLPLLQI